jgi:hypothetical protein
MSDRRFHYHAHAVGISGHITDPFEAEIEVQAASALPTSGGRSSAKHPPFQLRNVLSHAGVTSETTGRHHPEKDHHETIATAMVEGLDICGVVKADAIIVRVQCLHSASKSGEPRISLRGSKFENLRIHGKKVEVESQVERYHELDTMTKLRDHYRDSAQFRDDFHRHAYVGQESVVPERKRKYFPWLRHEANGELPEIRGYTVAPLFVVRSADGFEAHGNVVYVPDFGHIHFGELVIGPYQRRLAMMHVDLGSPTKGTIMSVSADGNGGHPIPP